MTYIRIAENNKSVTCSCVPNFFFVVLFYERGWGGGVFEIMKNDHVLVFLAVWVFPPSF